MNAKSSTKTFWTRTFVSIVMALVMVVIPLSAVFALTTPATDAGTGADVSGVGTIAWTGPHQHTDCRYTFCSRIKCSIPGR